MAYNIWFSLQSKLRNLLHLFFVKCSNLFVSIELWLLYHSRLSSKTRNLEVNNLFTLDHIQSIIQTFSHDQLIKIVEIAALHHPYVLDHILSIAESSSVACKIFVGCLGKDISSTTLHHFFSAYGEIEDAFVLFNKTTGFSKGCGFVIFKNIRSAVLALKDPCKKIHGKFVVTKLARDSFVLRNTAYVSKRQVYISNVPYDMSPARLWEHFSSYGQIEKGPLGFDKTTGKSRGFAIFLYKTMEGAKAAVSEPSKTVDGHHMTCRPVKEERKEKQQPSSTPPSANSMFSTFCRQGRNHQNRNPGLFFDNGGIEAGPRLPSPLGNPPIVPMVSGGGGLCPHYSGTASFGVPSAASVLGGRLSGGGCKCDDNDYSLWLSNYLRQSQQSPLTYQGLFSC